MTVAGASFLCAFPSAFQRRSGCKPSDRCGREVELAMCVVSLGCRLRSNRYFVFGVSPSRSTFWGLFIGEAVGTSAQAGRRALLSEYSPSRESFCPHLFATPHSSAHQQFPYFQTFAPLAFFAVNPLIISKLSVESRTLNVHPTTENLFAPIFLLTLLSTSRRARS